MYVYNLCLVATPDLGSHHVGPQVLNLDGNVLGKNGIASLARAFREGAVAELRQLHLRNNDIQGRVRHRHIAWNPDDDRFGCVGGWKGGGGG